MSLYGYARVSTLDQDLAIQRAALKAAGCKVVRAEKASGTRRGGRTELQVLLDFVPPGDTLVVTRLDRLARSMKDLRDIVHELKPKGVALRATEQSVDTGTAAGKAFLDTQGSTFRLQLDPGILGSMFTAVIDETVSNLGGWYGPGRDWPVGGVG